MGCSTTSRWFLSFRIKIIGDERGITSIVNINWPKRLKSIRILIDKSIRLVAVIFISLAIWTTQDGALFHFHPTFARSLCVRCRSLFFFSSFFLHKPDGTNQLIWLHDFSIWLLFVKSADQLWVVWYYFCVYLYAFPFLPLNHVEFFLERMSNNRGRFY